jgi:hypothetical protein
MQKKGKDSRPMSPEQELKTLHRENQTLRQEREFLRKLPSYSLETFYNPRRLPSSPGYRSLATFEEDRIVEARVA